MFGVNGITVPSPCYPAVPLAMADSDERERIVDAIRQVAQKLGRRPSRSEFMAASGVTQRRILSSFDGWNEAVAAAGLAPNMSKFKVEPSALLADYGRVVREFRRIPTQTQYSKAGKFSTDVFGRHFRNWAAVPKAFRDFAGGASEWVDVVALLPVADPVAPPPAIVAASDDSIGPIAPTGRHAKLKDRATYGNPIDFRGLRHEPVNEQGVVFLFGMVARELGYHVEAVQTGFPDCEAKRQVANGSWQRVRIEFEFESRNFRDHGHDAEGCDVIVCWHHNWAECPGRIEVVELRTLIRTLASGDE
jgi:hypothetical protein